jgi:phospholipase C
MSGWAARGGLIALAVAAVACGSADAPERSSGGTAPDAGPPGGGGRSGLDAAPDGGPRPGGPANKVVFVVAMENAETGLYEDTVRFPYLTSLLAQGARATAFMDLLPEGTPSEPHYILMEAGTTEFADHAFTEDDNPSAHNSTGATEHLVTQLGAAGISWLSYQEGIDADTGACPIASAGWYRPRHNPFVFFTDVAGAPPSKAAPVCADHHRPISALATDLAAGAVAAYNFITPNLCHDAHGHADCPPDDTADRWLQATLPPILSYVDAHEGVLLLVWDEAHAGLVLPFIALGPHVKRGYVGNQTYDHRSFLASVQAILGVPRLPSTTGAPVLSDLFAPGQFP